MRGKKKEAILWSTERLQQLSVDAVEAASAHYRAAVAWSKVASTPDDAVRFAAAVNADAVCSVADEQAERRGEPK